MENNPNLLPNSDIDVFHGQLQSLSMLRGNIRSLTFFARLQVFIHISGQTSTMEPPTSMISTMAIMGEGFEYASLPSIPNLFESRIALSLH